MYKNGSKCSICGTGKISEKIISEKFEYKGKALIVPDYHVYECDTCGEEIVDPKTLRATEKVLTDFRRGVDGLLTSDEIKTIRKKLGKTQAEMAEWLGVGEKNFARYENGQVTQSRTMDILLRILGEFPGVLNYVKGAHQYETLATAPQTVDIRVLPLKYNMTPSKDALTAEYSDAA